MALVEKLTEFKKGILLSQLLAQYCVRFKDPTAYELLSAMLKPKLLLKEQTLKEGYILKKLKRIRFALFIGFNRGLLEQFPESIR